jgi:hypothetical protein
VPIDAYVGTALNGWIAQILFIISTCATKASVLMFYRRMTKDTYNRLWLYAIWGALAFTFIYFAGVLITYCLICMPLSSYWLSYDFSYDKEYHCVNGNILSPLVGALSIFSDLYATALPWAMLRSYKLDISRRQQVALNIIFSLSLIVAGCGGGRLYWLWKINHSYDTSWNGFSLFVWSLLECELAVIFACAPALRAFFRRYLKDPLRRTLRSGHSRSNQSRTKDSSMQNSSTLRNSLPAQLAGAKEMALDESVLVEPDKETTFARQGETWSRASSDTFPNISTAEDYEMVLN